MNKINNLAKEIFNRPSIREELNKFVENIIFLLGKWIGNLTEKFPIILKIVNIFYEAFTISFSQRIIDIEVNN